MTKSESDALVDSLLHGKLPRNLPWTEVVDLISTIGTVEPHGQEFAFSVGTQRGFFKKPHGHDLDVEEVSELRKLLKSAFQPGGLQAPQTARAVVVVDHHGARVYRAAGDNTPVTEDSVAPYDPKGFHRHLIHKKEAQYQGERVPEESSFYQAIAQELATAPEIVLVGSGTGTSSAVDALQEFLGKRHKEIAARIVTVEKVDLSALTARQLEDFAKSPAA